MKFWQKKGREGGDKINFSLMKKLISILFLSLVIVAVLLILFPQRIEERQPHPEKIENIMSMYLI